MPEKKKFTRERSVKSAERVLILLETIGMTAEGTTFSQLNTELNIPKSSLHALLEVLTSRDYVEFDPESRRYTLGIRVWETGFAYHRHHGILKQAQEVLEKIVDRVNETVQFAKLVGSENVYLAKVDSTHALRLQSDVGTRLSAHATGIGKALLAQLDEDEVRRRFPGPDLRVYTRNTIPTLAGLLDELAEIRRRGFAIDNEEYTAGVFCMAVPVFDNAGKATTALSITVPLLRAARDELAEMLAAIAGGSLQITARVGGKAADPVLARLADPKIAADRIAELLASGRYRLTLIEQAPAQARLAPVR
jgi:DNA-binding IclR family transcriptional regulator